MMRLQRDTQPAGRLLFRLCFFAMTLVAQASALEFSIHPNAASMPAVTAILAQGDIAEGDVERLSEFLSTVALRKTTAIYLASPGGSLFEGMHLGRYFSQNHIKTVVEGNRICASACALAFLGGRDNTGNAWRSSSSNSRLGFHAFSSGEPMRDENETQLIVSLVLDYGREVDAPLELLILNFATPSNSIYWLSEDEICSLGIKLWDVPSNRFIC
jgi:hypothetical protein